MWGGKDERMLTVLLHDRQELDNDLGAGADQDLALAGLLGVVDALERIVEDGCLDHGGGGVRVSDSVTILKCSGVSTEQEILKAFDERRA